MVSVEAVLHSSYDDGNGNDNDIAVMKGSSFPLDRAAHDNNESGNGNGNAAADDMSSTSFSRLASVLYDTSRPLDGPIRGS